MTERTGRDEAVEVGWPEPAPRADKHERKRPRRAHAVYLPGRNPEHGGGLALGVEGGHSSPKNSKTRLRVQNRSVLTLPLIIIDAQPFVLPTARPMSSSVIRWRAHVFTNRPISSLSLCFNILSL